LSNRHKSEISKCDIVQRMSSSFVLDASLSSRYPIGDFVFAAGNRQQDLAVLTQLPAALESAVSGLSDSQLDTPYRDGGWMVRQLVHHVADSHMNAYVRCRLALTEDWPTIKPYEETRWAELADARTLPVEPSLTLLEALHGRWVALLQSLKDADFQRGYVHPESGRQTLEQVTGLYSWHSRHHTAHVTELRKRMGW
jgi:hypothetical protein